MTKIERKVLRLLAALALVVFSTMSLADTETHERRLTITGPGWKMEIDLGRFADPFNPSDNTVADVITGLLKGAPHRELLDRVLRDPARRARFQRLLDSLGSEAGDDPDSKARLAASDGNDVLFVTQGDPQSQIKAGQGHDIVVIVGGKGVTLNLAQAEVEVVLGGAGADILIGGGRSTVWIDAGPGDDIVIGGAANDLLSGGEGDDLIDGGQGNDVLRGGPGRDVLLGGAGDDQIFGGPGDDRLSGGAGNDALRGDDGDDMLEGGDGTDIAEYTGKFAEYRIFRVDHRDWRIADSRHGRDGSDTLRDIERLSFADWWAIPIDKPGPLPVDDAVNVREQPRRDVSYEGRDLRGAHVIRGARLLANDISLSGYPLRLRVLVDKDGRDVASGAWAQMEGGQAVLTPSGDVIFESTNPGNMRFRYRIADDQGNAGASAMSAEINRVTEMWASVYLHRSELAPPAKPRRECSETCTLDPGETHLVLTGIASINGTGNELSNTLIGNSNNNVLDGGSGPDVMEGGAGNDLYFVDHPGDRVIELPKHGIDTVWASVEGYVLPPNVENLLLGPGVHKGVGNELDNVIHGNERSNTLVGGPGNDMLDGGLGADVLMGGPGDDMYVVDDPGDRVIEQENEGRDTVVASISYVLPPHVEDLILSGRSDIDGTGNVQANRLIGNAGKNILSGGPGDDWLDGGPGDDTLQGGPGNDTYRFGAGGGHDTIIESDPTPGKVDTLSFHGFLRPDALWFMRNGDDLEIVLNEKDKVTIKDWYRGPAHRIERIQVGNQTLLPEGVESLVSAMSKHTRQTDPKGKLARELQELLDPLLKQVWHPTK